MPASLAWQKHFWHVYGTWVYNFLWVIIILWVTLFSLFSLPALHFQSHQIVATSFTFRDIIDSLRFATAASSPTSLPMLPVCASHPFVKKHCHAFFQLVQSTWSFFKILLKPNGNYCWWQNTKPDVVRQPRCYDHWLQLLTWFFPTSSQKDLCTQL